MIEQSSRRAVIVTALFLAVTSSAATAGGHPSPQLVVRYAAGADARLAGSTLDDLHRRFGVSASTPLVDGLPASRSARAAAWTQRRARIRARFPERAARRPAHAASIDLSAVHVLDLAPGTDVAAAATAFARDPGVVWAEPVGERSASYVPNDPYLASGGLWGLTTIGAPAAWDTAKGQGIVVAVVDTGIKATHKDLAANMWRNPGEIPRNRIDDDGNGFVDDVGGWDFVKRTAKVKDKHGHGTHVAGTVAAVGDDALGVLGVAYRATVMDVRGLDERGNGRTTDLARAIEYAAANGADVINCSWGGFGISDAIADAVIAATDLGAVVVFAAGNEGTTGNALGEANLPQVIAVAASTQTDAVAGFSNFGDAISVAAPGVDILSTRGAARVGGLKVGSRYVRLSGTSMAAPHVAGLAALLLANDPTLTTEEVRWHLELNAHQPGYPGFEGAPWNPHFGWGRIDAARAFDPPPVTTRLHLDAEDVHAFAGAVTPDLASLRVRFTSTTPVAWTSNGSGGIVPSDGAGNGDADLTLAVDATGASPGTVLGTTGVSATAASDGGAQRDLRIHLHEDARVGGPVLLTDDSHSLNDPPAIASNGSTLLVVWPQDIFRLVAMTVAADGTVTGPFPLIDLQCQGANCWEYSSNALEIASDGDGFLLAYRTLIDVWDLGSRDTRTEHIRTLRIDAAGQPVGAPVDVATQVQSFSHTQKNYDAWFGNTRVAWDGAGWAVAWGVNRENGNQTDTTTAYLRRLAADNVPIGTAVQTYPTPITASQQFVVPDLACVAPGDCLVAWIEWNGDTPDGGGLFVRNAMGVRVLNGVAQPPSPGPLLANVNYDDVRGLRVAASTTGYGLLALRNSCPTSTSTFCGFDLVGGRATATGAPVDTAGVRLNQRPDGDAARARPFGLAFDGTDFVAVFIDLEAQGPYDFTRWPRPLETGFPVFAARFSPAGTLLDTDEPIGRLVHPGQTAIDGRLVADATGVVAVWKDLRHPGPLLARSYWMQRLFPH